MLYERKTITLALFSRILCLSDGELRFIGMTAYSLVAQFGGSDRVVVSQHLGPNYVVAVNTGFVAFAILGVSVNGTTGRDRIAPWD